MMATDLSFALDAVLMARAVGVEPDAWQAKLLREQPARCALLASRQSGKSTVTALLALHTALYQPPALILLFSPALRQSQELFRTVVGFHAKLKGAPRLVSENTMRAELSNGSRIIALPGSEKTVRGFAAPDLVVIDEAARVDDDLIAAVRPMLSTKANGRLIALTTPRGKRGWFHEAWFKSDGWTKVRVPASQCPRISQAHLDEELRELGKARFDEEYNLAFHDDQEAAFPVAVIEAAFSPEVRPLWAM